VILDTLKSLDIDYPASTPEHAEELARCREALVAGA
jgi:hypothetical protein